MKKVCFLAAAAAFALTSCATSEAVDVESTTGEAPIGFGTFLDRASRGSTAASPKAASLDLDGLKNAGFTVLAYSTGETDWSSYSEDRTNPNFMDDQPVTWDGSGSVWTYIPLKYWPRKDNATWYKVTFFAFSTATGASADGQASDNPKIAFTTQDASADQVDLVAAVAPNASGGTNSGKVQFTFNHILSKIGFSAKLAADYGNATAVKVKSLRVYYKSGEVKKEDAYTFSSDNTVSAWASSGTTTFSEITTGAGDQLFSGNEELSSSSAVDLCSSGTYLMLIPQALDAGDMYVELVYDQETTVGSVTDTKTATLKVNMPAITWEPGKQYTYNLLVSLTGVTFDVLSVSAWADGTSPGDVNVP
jgi:hypothetical protein